jgi:thioredoxin 1
MAKNITLQNFEQEVLNSDKPILLDFWAEWCGPCRMLTPILEKLKGEIGDTAEIGKVNVDEQRELAQKFGVMSIPSVFVMKGGRVVDSAVGVRQQAYYKSMIDKALSS